MHIHDKLLGALRSHAIAKLLVQGVSWAGTIYILRMLDSEALGLYGIALVVFNYATLIYEGGLLEAIVQRPPADHAGRSAVFTLLMSVALGAALLMLSIAYPVAWLVQAPDVVSLIAALAGALVLTALGILPQARLMRDMRFDTLATIAAFQAVISTAFAVTLAVLGAGEWALIGGLIAGAAVRAIALNIRVPSLYWPTRALDSARRYLRVSAVLILDGVLWRWYTSIDVFLLGRWAGTSALGQYTFAQQVANLPLEKISTVVNDVSLPAYAELAREREQASRLMLETIRTHAMIGLPIFWGLAAVADVAVPLIFGKQWEPAVFPMMAFAFIAPLRLIGSVETPAMTGIGAPEVLLKTKYLIVPCMTISLLVGCWYGVTGACLAWLIMFPICYLIAFRWVIARIGLALSTVFDVVKMPTLAALFMFLGVWTLRRSLADTAMPAAAMLTIMILAGAVIYLSLLRQLDAPSFALVLSRARQLFLPAPQAAR